LVVLLDASDEPVQVAPRDLLAAVSSLGHARTQLLRSLGRQLPLDTVTIGIPDPRPDDAAICGALGARPPRHPQHAGRCRGSGCPGCGALGSGCRPDSGRGSGHPAGGSIRPAGPRGRMVERHVRRCVLRGGTAPLRAVRVGRRLPTRGVRRGRHDR
jgi:hypothetical protein